MAEPSKPSNQAINVASSAYKAWLSRFQTATGRSKLAWGCLPLFLALLVCGMFRSLGQSLGMIQVAPTPTTAPTMTTVPTSAPTPSEVPPTVEAPTMEPSPTVEPPTMEAATPVPTVRTLYQAPPTGQAPAQPAPVEPTSPPQAGCVNFNSASFDDLRRIINVDDDIAHQIIDLRSQRPFRGWNDLVDRVKGIGENNVKDIKAQGLGCF